jgi:tRNA nucleotidyltransferase (CCA-adding enzyme)
MTVLRPTPSVLDIAGRLEQAGFEAWCVGGAVRDALLGGAPLDWDLATTARPEQVQALFGRKRTIPVGIEFGTVAVLDADGVAHEITTFRRDVDTDGRHAVVEFGASLDDDLARRDFTINALAWRPATRELRDPFQGRGDLEARIVRAVGDPDARMREDRLRALRAIRFAARFGFEIEPATLRAIEASAPFLTRLSAERVQQELVKTMEQVRQPAAALTLWRSTGALGVLVPPLAGVGDVALATLDALPMTGAGGRRVPQRTSNRVAALVLDLPPAVVRSTLQGLRFSKHEVAWASAMADAWHELGGEMAGALREGPPADARVRRWLSRVGRLHAGAFLRMAGARWCAERAAGGEVPGAAAVRALHRRMRGALFSAPLELADLAIGGDDLRRAGIPAGPIYAKILHALLERVLDDPARNTPEALLAEVPRIVAAPTTR